MNINIINKDNICLLNKFIKLNDSDFFRYYHSRTIDAIKNHIVTIVLTLKDNIIGYGHLDFEKKVWLGICILQEYRKQGYSKIILEFLFLPPIVTVCANKSNLPSVKPLSTGFVVSFNLD